MNARRTFLAAAVGAALTLTAGTGAVHAQVKWDMPTPYPDTNFHTRNIRQFVEDVNKGTGGKLQITVHPANSLIKMAEMKRAVQTGQVPIAEVLMSVLSNEAAVFAFESVPFLAPTTEKQLRLWAAARPAIQKRLDSQGMMLLYSVAWPPSAIHSKKEINSLADMKGVKLRAYNPATMRFGELAGATPVNVLAPEVPQAFATGIIDAQINSPAGAVDTQTWDFTRFTYEAQVISPQNMVFVNKAAWAKLDAATQKVVLDAAAAAEKRGWEIRETENKKNLETLASKGVKIQPPSAKLAGEFQEIGKKMAAEWAAKAGPEGDAILKAVGN
jgi:TRAP-type C4-dicarboxylate transport system substrate-binding protein